MFARHALLGLSLFMLSFISFAIQAQKAPPIPDYQAIRVAQGTYVIHGPIAFPNPKNQGFMNNPAWVETPEGVIIVDPGSSVQTSDMVLRVLRQHTDAPVIAVFNSHEHGDHWLGNQAIRAAFPEVPIYAHTNMIAALNKGLGKTWVDLMLNMTHGATAGTVSTAPDHFLRDGEELTVGGMQIRVHHVVADAHSHTDVMLEFPSLGLLFTGDTAVNGRIVRMDDGSFTGNIQALDHALSLEPKVVVPGHGPTGGAEILREYRRYLSTLYNTVVALYDEGLSDFEMKDPVIQATADFHDWAGYDEEIGRNINRAYLEAEAKAF